jgi:arsenate reductase
MAEALLNRYAGDRFEVHSAGLDPRGIHPLTIQVMHEIGISMEGHRSKTVGEFLGKVAVRYAITVCERTEESCPRVWPFTPLRLYWPFQDPAAFTGNVFEQLDLFRQVRDAIDNRICRWLNEEMELDMEGGLSA